MLFRSAASAALLACVAHANAEPRPYKPAMMPVLGMSLARRDTNGYQPEQTVCSGEGDTCAEACGTGYAECSSVSDSIHCFNPQADQQCCQDGTGNSCEAGYYCTHDSQNETFCCPDGLDLVQCAAAYTVTGGLETPEITTSTPAPTSTSILTTSSAILTTSSELTTSVATTTSVSQFNTTSTVYETTKSVTSIFSAVSSGSTSAWTGSNSTITSAAPTQPAESAPPAGTTGPAPSTPAGDSGAAATGVSALLLLAAGAVALL